ncbi:MAG: FxsA family protein [Actinomycetota bacterium]|nr:FxsA family protein [Actinomycetota bacterium]
MLAPLVLLFVAVPILELAVILQVGQEIGAWWTIGLLIADSVVGSVLLRAQGRVTWRRFTQALQAGRPPAREVVDGALVLIGGTLLLTPGFVTDLAGLLLLLPPTRAIVRRALAKRLTHRMVVGMTGVRHHAATGNARATDPRVSPYSPSSSAHIDIDGAARESDAKSM